MITVPVPPVELTLTPEQLAAEFCDLDDDGQAAFFSTIAELVKEWPEPFGFQCDFIRKSESLTEGGKQIIRDLQIIVTRGEE